MTDINENISIPESSSDANARINRWYPIWISPINTRRDIAVINWDEEPIFDSFPQSNTPNP